MAFRGFRENRTKVHTRTDQLVDSAHKIATQQLLPQVAQMSRNAVTVDRTEFYFYRRKRTGRRCSCSDIEVPDGTCKNCFQTGIVGGYDKYGCHEEILDVTRPEVRLVNMRPAYELMRRPVFFVLDDGARAGTLEFDFNVRRNVALVDLTQINVSISNPVQSKMQVFIKSNIQENFTPFNDASFSIALRASRITIQLRFSRENAQIQSPLFRDARFRYRLIDVPRIIADVPVRTESVVLQEYGIYDTSQSITMYLPDNPRKVGNEDFFIMVEEGTRWKVVQAAQNKPSQQLTSNFLTCQSIPAHNPIYEFPV